MSAFKKAQEIYQMTEAEKQNVKNFLEEVKKNLPHIPHQKLLHFVKHLCKVQNPSKRDYPFIDNIIHGIEVARICMLKDTKCSEALLLAAIGHDWDRACGEKTVKASDYPNTEDGNKLYKEHHATNSTNLFCAEMKKFYKKDLVNQVYFLILNHEIGGEGDLEVLDFADGMVFFSPDTSDYYRNERKYKGPNGENLSSNELELERKNGFSIKVRFMTETMGLENLSILKDYLKKNRSKMNPIVMKELDELLDL